MKIKQYRAGIIRLSPYFLVLFFDYPLCLYNEAPKISKSMHIALNDLGLSHLYVIYPGKESYPVAENISVVSLADVGDGYSFPPKSDQRQL